MEQEALNTRRIIYGLAVSFLGIVVLRIVFPERSLDQTGLRALLDSFFALCLLAGVLLLAAGVGARALRLLRISSLSNSEQILFSTSLGLGILAYLILALALIGLLNPWLIFLIFVLLGIWLKRDLVQSLLRVREMLGELWRTVRAGPIYLTTFIVLGGLVALLSLFQALTPPTGVDGLIYHLPVPQLYLNAGRMIPTPDFTPAAFPSAIEMLFAIGQAFGSDVFSQLIHLTYLGFFVGGTILAGRRFLGESGGWLAAAILLGMPVLPIWGVLPYIDIAWALYEFLAIYFLLIWVKKANASAYVLSGILCGLAVGSKYLALGGFASAVLVILLNVRRDGLFSTARNVLVFSLTAILVASPWYLRNWLWYGNPFYPFYQGLFGGSLDPMSGLSSHQLNYGIIDYLLIPLRLIVDRKQFVGVYGSIEFLSPFFLLFLVYPFMRRKNSLDRLAVFALIRYVGWVATTPTRTRYMLPIFPVLCLLAAHVGMLIAEKTHLRRFVRILGGGLLGGLLVATLLYSILFFVDVNPLVVVMGFESKDSFLSRRLTDYKALQFIQQELPSDARVRMLYDSRIYYCDERCVPDLFQAQWEAILTPNPSVPSVVQKLRQDGITHLLLSLEDANYLFYYTPEDSHERNMRFFYEDFIPACGETIYEDEWVSVYELTCE